MDKYYVEGWGNSWHRTLSDEEKEAYKKAGINVDTFGEFFIKDGCMNETEYRDSNKKIVFITKEAYTSETDLNNHIIDITRDYYDPNINTHFWRRLHQWAYGLLNTSKEEGIADFNSDERIIENEKNNWEINVNSELYKNMQKVAIVNLKKSNGLSSTDYDYLWNYMIPQGDDDLIRKNYRDNLLNQIEQLDPDIIVCCGKGVLDIIKDDKMYGDKIEEKGGRIYQWKDSKGKTAKLINYVHPSIIGISDDILFYGLVVTYLKSLD